MHCVDLGESFPTSIYLQKSASIQPRTSPSKFGGKYSILFTGVLTRTAASNHQILKDDPDPCFDEDPNNAFLDRQADHMRRRVNRSIISGATLAAGTYVGSNSAI